MPRIPNASVVEKKPLGFRTTRAKSAYLRARARASGIGHTQMLRAIFNDWLRRGAPPITEFESKRGVIEMPPALMEEVSKGSLFYP